MIKANSVPNTPDIISALKSIMLLRKKRRMKMQIAKFDRKRDDRIFARIIVCFEPCSRIEAGTVLLNNLSKPDSDFIGFNCFLANDQLMQFFLSVLAEQTLTETA